MLKQSLVLIGLTLTLSANAATLVVSGGQLMGATGVDVGGINYDVSFVDGTCDGLFDECTSFVFTTQDSAKAASQALLDQVFLGQFDEFPDRVNGIENTVLGAMLTPYSPLYGPSRVASSYAGNFSHVNGGEDFVYDEILLESNVDTGASGQRAYAVWDPSPVPLPAAAWLFMSAIAGLAGGKRISRSKRGV